MPHNRFCRILDPALSVSCGGWLAAATAPLGRGRMRLWSRRAALWVVLWVVASGGVAAADTPQGTAPDSVIAALIAQVETGELIDYVNQLTGETPAQVGGAPYTFTTRDTESGEAIAKATQFAYEFLATHNLAVEYHEWRRCGYESRNVVAEKVGVERPAEIVLVTAHIDSIADTGPAPGADDDASGTAGVMAIAAILAPVSVQRTVRFVLFTGEEQGLCGSAAYARQAANAGEAIVAVYNMDMIAWDEDDEPILRLHTRPTNDPGYAADLAIANTFVAVVNAYGLSGVLSPRVAADGLDAADHYSFWDEGYAAILAIEDDDEEEGDFNPYYHTSQDRVSAYNQAYFTNFVKASVGTAAELAGVVPTPVGSHRQYLPHLRR